MRTVLFASFYRCKCHLDVLSVYYVHIDAKVNHTGLKNAVEAVFSNLKYTCEFFGRFFVM